MLDDGSGLPLDSHPEVAKALAKGEIPVYPGARLSQKGPWASERQLGKRSEIDVFLITSDAVEPVGQFYAKALGHEFESMGFKGFVQGKTPGGRSLSVTIEHLEMEHTRITLASLFPPLPEPRPSPPKSNDPAAPSEGAGPRESAG
ncbi:MAG: hypothetical protein HY248_03955 [Fimbriimonas ginsengisoli]|nr:hypothetical protein [Fimbriimonas ginsengisoli]